MELTSVLLKPVQTEKATELREKRNQVTFYVHPDANKMEIAKAVESAFDVKVTAVNVSRKAPRLRMRRHKPGTVPGSKKAYVTLRDGDSIEMLEGGA
ncbi:MAG: 50S ribosomal protein L23 [Desulfovibrio sp.]|jgi:large subunit ribosomal protein L23|nr:50S ribosomal protein L23 [Desulfovibrio sp.]